VSNIPLDQHAFLSDCRSAALVTAGGSVDWLCLPRFDSPSIFGRLLDEDAGHFLIAPASSGFESSWRYRDHGLVLDTTWSGPDGELVVSDALALGTRERGHDLGRVSPGVLLRQVRCVRGSVPVRVEFVPRPEYGLVHPRFDAARGAVVTYGGSATFVLSTGLEMDLAGDGATATVTLNAGQHQEFAMQRSSAWSKPPAPWSPQRIQRRLGATERSWEEWSAHHQNYDGPLSELVYHSGVVLRGLTYAFTGAMVAAPTTSLPEGVGSGRTWDYRYAWVRDASMTMQGLFVAACPDEAGRFFSFLARSSSTQLDRGLDLQIMFGIGGERDLSERELPHLSGWRDSPPVRCGNGAWNQRQLDVYGSLLDAAYVLREQLANMQEHTRMFLIDCVEAAASRWDEDDQGIWEVRGEARPFLHSKLMCWVALDRGLAMVTLLKADDREADWTAARAEIWEAIVSQGWSERVGAFTQSFGSDELDASVLLMASVGFLEPDDPRLLSTIDAVEDGLGDDNGLLFRYRADDGIDSAEGVFLLCTFWLAEALAVTGQVERSRTVLERAASCATSLGLFAEQVDPVSGELLGNYPQAFSHLGLVNAAQALADAERRQA